MKARVATALAVALVGTAGASAAAGCGGGASTASTQASSEPATTTPGGSAAADTVAAHPEVVASVCRNVQESGQTKQINNEALAPIAALAIKAQVSPAKLLDEVLSRC